MVSIRQEPSYPPHPHARPQRHTPSVPLPLFSVSCSLLCNGLTFKGWLIGPEILTKHSLGSEIGLAPGYGASGGVGVERLENLAAGLC